MSYSSKGILSIVDRKGRYMGMQNIAEGFLTERCIHISTQGPEDNPTAVIITVYDKEDAGKNFEDINFSALKAEYDRNATPSMFSVMLSCATANFDYDKKYNNGTCYRFYRNGDFRDVSPEMFNNPDTDFSKLLAEWE